jgi:hypothetical protein
MTEAAIAIINVEQESGSFVNAVKFRPFIIN